ncbi:alpha/beta fold hydrolase [Streptomyces sp. NPDC102476]|uniref:alpha/beta fold hydrolase n=1 Tax=Streptomyces sp. NPDC102476 TaxID=3366181 RepID=UPI00381CDBE6
MLSGRSAGRKRGSCPAHVTPRDQRPPCRDALSDASLAKLTRTAGGRRAGKQFLARLKERTHDRDKAISLTSYFAQLKAIHRWGLAQPQNLSVIHQPVFVANGESDRMVPTNISFELARRLPNADLVVYPDAGHGGIFQFHEQFVAEALDFLER